MARHFHIGEIRVEFDGVRFYRFKNEIARAREAATEWDAARKLTFACIQRLRRLHVAHDDQNWRLFGTYQEL